MRRLASRWWLGSIAVVALAIIGLVLFRSSISSHIPRIAANGSAPALASVSGKGEWAMEGYDPARTRALPTSLALPITRQRVFHIPNDQGVGSPVSIGRNTLLVESDGYLRAVDLGSGKQRWAFAETGRYLSPAIAGNIVFIRAEADNVGYIYALDLRTGKQLWSFKPRRISDAGTSYWGGHISSPVVAGGVVFIGAGKELYALDAASGDVRWEYSGKDFVASSATVAENRVFISDARHLNAIDLQTGKLVWQSSTTFSIYFAPIVANQSVFFTNGDNVIALNTADGTKRWEASYPNESLLPGAVQGSTLFIKSVSILHALDIVTGKELWRSEDPQFVSFPAIAGQQLFAITGTSAQTTLIALDTTTGKSIWQQAVPALANTAPVIAGQTLYVRTTDGRVLGLLN